MDLMFINYVKVMLIIPVISILLFALMLFFVLKFDRTEHKMNFVEKIKWLDKTLKLIVILYVGGLLLGLIVIIAVGGIFNASGILAQAGSYLGTSFAVVLLPFLIQLYFYYLIYKEYKILINNLLVEKIFDQANVRALKKIAKVTIWILILNLSVYLLGMIVSLLGMLAIIYLPSSLFMVMGTDINFNATLKADVLVYFVVCIMVNIFAEIMDKATAIYEENKLTI